MSTKLPKLYDELAEWWQIFSPTKEYIDEASFFRQLFKRESDKPVLAVLELGAGGGNIAYFLKQDFAMTLADVSKKMQAMSKKQNPDCTHVIGDMRTMRLGKEFDGVFIHDAIMYMTTQKDLLAALTTAFVHCKPGGIVVVAPDYVAETFRPTTYHDGNDKGDRSLRYMEWTYDPDPSDSVVNCEYIFALRDNTTFKTVVDRQVNGIFPRQVWLELLRTAGFTPRAVPDPSTGGERLEVFVGHKNGQGW